MFIIPFLAILLLSQGQAGVNSEIPATIRPRMPGPNQIIASVDGVPLTAGDLDPMVWQIYHKSIMRDFVDYLVVKNAAAAAKVTVSEDEVNSRVSSFFDQLRTKLRPGQTIEANLQENDFSDARIYLRAKTELLLEKIQLLGFHPGDWVRVSRMVFETPGKKPEIMKSEAAKALDFYNRLKGGSSWNQLLIQQTSDPAVLQSKGNIGWHSLDIFPASTRDQFKQMKIGQVTSPVETATAIQIFRLDGLGEQAVGPDLEALKERFLASTVAQTKKAILDKAKVVYGKEGS